MTPSQKITDAVLKCTNESLLLAPGKANLESKLFTELNASSVDLVDILSRLEKIFSLSLLKPTDFPQVTNFRIEDVKLKDLALFIEKKTSEMH